MFIEIPHDRYTIIHATHSTLFGRLRKSLLYMHATLYIPSSYTQFHTISFDLYFSLLILYCLFFFLCFFSFSVSIIITFITTDTYNLLLCCFSLYFTFSLFTFLTASIATVYLHKPSPTRLGLWSFELLSGLLSLSLKCQCGFLTALHSICIMG